MPKSDNSKIYKEQSLSQWLRGQVVGIDVLSLMLFFIQLLPVLLIQNHPFVEALLLGLWHVHL